MDNTVQEITKWLNTELLSRFIEDSKVHILLQMSTGDLYRSLIDTKTELMCLKHLN